MAATREWLPNPEPGASICLGLDGSEVSDYTAIKAETSDGLLFTPRWMGRPTIWNPADYGGRMPRHEVDAAVDWLFDAYDVQRMYCDPPYWETEVDQWALRHGDDRVIRWPTYRAQQMHASLERFVIDLGSGRIKHDGCPITTEHVRNARMLYRRDGRYVLGKPDVARKIDAAVTSVLAHEAAADSRASGWGSEEELPPLTFGIR